MVPDVVDIIVKKSIDTDIGIISVSRTKGAKMSEGKKKNAFEEIISNQSQVVAMLALRVTTLETLLLEKGIITEDEAVKKTTELSEAFVKQTQEALKKALESQQEEYN